MTSEDRKLYEIIQRIVEQRQDQDRISPTWIATEALLELDPERIAPALVYIGCHLHCRQIARGYLPKRFEGNEEDKISHPLFPELQARYPTARSGGKEEPEYIREELMQPEDYLYNIRRMEREVRAKQAHVDSLRARFTSRFPLMKVA